MAEAPTLSGIQAENRMLHRVIETITSTVELAGVLGSIVDLVAEATGGDACFLHLWDDEAGCLVLRAASAQFQDAVGRVRLRLGEGVAGWAAEHREVVSIPDDKWADPRYKYIPELKGERFTSMLSVPVVSASGALVGVFNVHTRARREFGPRDVGFLRLTASLVAVAIEHADLFRTLAEKERVLEAHVRETIEAQEEERRRVAAEIHDGVTQQLVSIWYRLHACERSIRDDPERAARELVTARELVDEALTEARVAIYDLRPSMLDDLGLSPSLRALATRQLDGDVELVLDVQDVPGLPPHYEVALYRIAQEAVTNIRKHAHARKVRLALHAGPDELELSIEDDGLGFAAPVTASGSARTTFGLTGMAERASLVGGEFSIRAVPGGGTAVSVRIPQPEAEARR
ncbi:MAG: GAF domain-containing protein [Thermoplasmata archaeon]|nr:GAF domain-containing protein [Thermoplasmata archaeon]